MNVSNEQKTIIELTQWEVAMLQKWLAIAKDQTCEDIDYAFLEKLEYSL